MYEYQTGVQTAGVTVEQLDFPPLVLGEGPYWIESLQALMLADVYSNILRRRFFPSGRHQVLHLDSTGDPLDVITAAIPVEGERDVFVGVEGKHISFLHWAPYDPDDHNTTSAIIHTTKDFAFNDAKCDPQGRLWAGTTVPLDENVQVTEANASGLYRMDSKLEVTKWATVSLSNGLAWSLDRKNFYYVDSHTRTVDVFDYDDESGAISNRRVILDFNKAGLRDQFPDGMAIDVDGNLWVASFGGHQVICVDPRTGRILRRVAIPAKNVSSVCWGGPDYATLFVTSGTLGMKPEEIRANSLSGGTFAVTGLGTKGLPAAQFRVNFLQLQAQQQVAVGRKQG
ncbi:regucalcin-like [Penaeus chinensis]|uniref:regucalcin-like n=1 Tax=Penaeus chinensis TaxID=139456 RepID=UPI001FB5DA71|nr:regucalcin-like [Penaeus chinensis]